MSLKAQRRLALAFFEDCSVPVTEWLTLSEERQGDRTCGPRWPLFVEACALVQPYLEAQDGLRQPPRVLCDPLTDQWVLVFKCENNGDTFLVSQFGVCLGEVEVGFRRVD